MVTSFNNWRLSRKMLSVFSLIGLVLIAVALTGEIAASRLSASASDRLRTALHGTATLSQVLAQIREQRIIVYSHMTAKSPEEAAKLEDRMSKAQADVAATVDEYAAVAAPVLAEEVAKLRAATDALAETNDRILKSKYAAPGQTLDLVKGEGKEASHAAIGQADLLVRMTGERAKQAEVADDANRRKVTLFTAFLSVASLAALVGLWWLIAKTLSRPMADLASVTTLLADGGTATVPHRDRGDELGDVARSVETFRIAAVARAEADARAAAEQATVSNSLGEGLQALSAGDLTAEVTADYPAGYAALKTNFNDALASLRTLIGAVGSGAEAIRTGSTEIASASEDLARRTESNAASLEQTSAALVQIDGRLKASASASMSTVARADQAIATVGGGRAIAEEAVQAMGRVSDSAKGIDSVIEGLDKIAYQTRVLAMNAAVEAGRAGDAGRCFAVVADLVSALAMRAEEEAKRARDQLTVTQTEIVTAVQSVQKVDGALANISGDVGEVHKLLEGMAGDNEAQSAAITQISAAIGSMDQSTQQNAAMVEQTSAAARNLTSEVAALAEQAAAFKVDDAAPRARPAAIVLQPKPRQPTRTYVSPVKALPAKSKPKANGHDGDNWSAF